MKPMKPMKAKNLKRLMNIWPPFAGAGIKVKDIAPDYTSVDVELNMRPYNKNYVGTHFGGSMFAMTDPFFMLMLMNQIGKDYIVWDKSANIEFRKPGKGKLSAHFNLTAKQVRDIKKAADTNKKVEPKFTVDITDETGDVVATVEKTLYVRRKPTAPKAPKP